MIKYELQVFGKYEGQEELFIRENFSSEQEAIDRRDYLINSSYLEDNYPYTKYTRSRIEKCNCNC